MLRSGEIVATRFLATAASKVQHVAVVGAGIMGTGIAQVCAQKNFRVTLVDRDAAQLKTAERNIKKAVERAAMKAQPQKSLAGGEAVAAPPDVKSILQNVDFFADIEKAVAPADLVIEAVVEQLPVKHAVLKKIEASVQKKTLIVTNTSSLSLKSLGSVIEEPKRFAGLHFFNPVPKMQLVEIVKGSSTSNDTFNKLKAFVKDVDHVPVSVKDTPGFIVNRILVPIILDGIRMYERGDASISDIDTAMKLGCGLPMGVFQLADFVGLDTLKFVVDGWHAEFPDNPEFETPSLLASLVAGNHCGFKTNSGFYLYKQGKITGVNPQAEIN